MTHIKLANQSFPNEIFQIGTRFASIAGTTICLNGTELEKMRIQETKTRIIDYLKNHDKAKISDLSEKLNIPPRFVGKVLKELEEEGYIKEAD